MWTCGPSLTIAGLQSKANFTLDQPYLWSRLSSSEQPDLPFSLCSLEQRAWTLEEIYKFES